MLVGSLKRLCNVVRREEVGRAASYPTAVGRSALSGDHWQPNSHRLWFELPRTGRKKRVGLEVSNRFNRWLSWPHGPVYLDSPNGVTGQKRKSAPKVEGTIPKGSRAEVPRYKSDTRHWMPAHKCC